MNNTVENDLFGFPTVRVIQKIKRWTFFWNTVYIEDMAW